MEEESAQQTIDYTLSNQIQQILLFNLFLNAFIILFSIISQQQVTIIGVSLAFGIGLNSVSLLVLGYAVNQLLNNGRNHRYAMQEEIDDLKRILDKRA